MNKETSMDSIKMAAWEIIDVYDKSWTLGDIREAFDVAIKDERVTKLVAQIMLGNKRTQIISEELMAQTKARIS